jgi:branched-chain amino acid transport system ATP-binding protein
MGHDSAIATECEALLAQFRLTEHAEQPTRELPYGKRRLLEIGLAVAMKPSVLLLDEPAAGVPAAERQDILDTVAALPDDVSVLLIEHDMDLVFSFARHMTVLVNGAVLTEGTPQQIANDPQVKAVYLGDMEVVHA